MAAALRALDACVVDAVRPGGLTGHASAAAMVGAHFAGGRHPEWRFSTLASSESAVRMSKFLAMTLLCLAAVAQAGAAATSESSRIEYLLTVVASLHDAQFIRNGKAYDSAAAASHLRTKLRVAGGRVKTAEDFIRYCASESSVSGEPYEIRFADGRVVMSAEFLRQKLLEFDTQNPAAD